MKTTIIKTILFLILFLKSFNLFAYDGFISQYATADCSFVSNNSLIVAEKQLQNMGYAHSQFDNSLFVYYGENEPINVDHNYNKPTINSTEVFNSKIAEKYTCFAEFLQPDYLYRVAIFRVFSVDQSGDTSRFIVDQNNNSFGYIQILGLIKLNKLDQTLPIEYECESSSVSYDYLYSIPKYRYSSSENKYIKICSSNFISQQDPACRSFLSQDIPVIIQRELTEEEKNSSLSLKVTKNFGDPNDPNDNLYCAFQYKNFVKTDNYCYYYNFEYVGFSYTAADGELGNIPPDISNYQDLNCEYLLTGEAPPEQDPETPDPNQDTDNDGIPDIEDPDIDGDGVNNEEDAFPNNPNEDTDTDGDGVGNNTDAFPNNPNEDTDTDGDGIGNNEDEDDDNDGTPDVNDVFPLNPNEDTDTDGDGFGDNSDPDPNTPNSGTGEGETGEENEGDFGLGEMGYDERSFYEPKYPDGLTGVFTDNYNRIMEESSFGEMLQSIDISGSIGTSQQYPIYEFEFDLFGEVYTNSIDTSNILDTGINFWVVLNTLLIFLSILTAIKIIF